MPRTPAQFDRMREESRRRIVDAALALFARHGYAATTVRMIAEEAGAAQGLLYNYFDGKQALLQAIFEQGMRDVEEDIATASGAGTPQQALERLIRAAFETLRDNTDFWRLSYQIRMQPEVLSGLGEQVHAWSGAILARIASMLAGAGSPEADARARVVFAAIDGAAQHYVLDPDRYPLGDVVEQMIRLAVPLAAPAGSPSSQPRHPR
jgi:AcrR family transcriptional regulator